MVSDLALNGGVDSIPKKPNLFLVIYASQSQNSELQVKDRANLLSILQKFVSNRIRPAGSASNNYLAGNVADAWGKVSQDYVSIPHLADNGALFREFSGHRELAKQASGF